MKIRKRKGVRPSNEKPVKHAWMRDRKCAPLVREVWLHLKTETPESRGVPGYLRAMTRVQRVYSPDKVAGLDTLVTHAQEIISGQRKYYELPTG